MAKPTPPGLKLVQTPIDEHLHRRARTYGVAHGKDLQWVIEEALRSFLPEQVEVPAHKPTPAA